MSHENMFPPLFIGVPVPQGDQRISLASIASSICAKLFNDPPALRLFVNGTHDRREAIESDKKANLDAQKAQKTLRELTKLEANIASMEDKIAKSPDKGKIETMTKGLEKMQSKRNGLLEETSLEGLQEKIDAAVPKKHKHCDSGQRGRKFEVAVLDMLPNLKDWHTNLKAATSLERVPGKLQCNGELDGYTASYKGKGAIVEVKHNPKDVVDSVARHYLTVCCCEPSDGMLECFTKDKSKIVVPIRDAECYYITAHMDGSMFECLCTYYRHFVKDCLADELLEAPQNGTDACEQLTEAIVQGVIARMSKAHPHLRKALDDVQDLMESGRILMV